MSYLCTEFETRSVRAMGGKTKNNKLLKQKIMKVFKTKTGHPTCKKINKGLDDFLAVREYDDEIIDEINQCQEIFDDAAYNYFLRFDSRNDYSDDAFQWFIGNADYYFSNYREHVLPYRKR